MRKKASLKDIANRLGVSTALVSYVLNNKKEGRISKEIAARIRDVARELKYTTNQIAKSLKTNKSNTIGLVVSDISNPFFSTLAHIIQEEAGRYGFTVISGSSDEQAEKSQQLVNVLIDRQVEGLIFAASEGSEHQVLDLMDTGTPLVLIDRYFPDLEVSHVAIDNFTASFEAVKHLLTCGIQRIAVIAHDTSLYHTKQRIEGYRHALETSGFSFDENLIIKVPAIHRGEEVKTAVDRLLALPEPASGVLFTSSVLSTAALKYLNTLSVKVPDQLNIISFDESDAAYLFYAPLTHIRQPLEQMGKLATSMLIDIINGSKEIRKVNLPAELVLGRSTTSPREH
jgi:LacI family transcriptional regulator